jgi:hypothetical protein
MPTNGLVRQDRNKWRAHLNMVIKLQVMFLETLLVRGEEPLFSQEEFCSRKSVSQLKYCLSGFYKNITRILKDY